MFPTCCVSHNQPSPPGLLWDRMGVYSEAPKVHRGIQNQHLWSSSLFTHSAVENKCMWG